MTDASDRYARYCTRTLANVIVSYSAVKEESILSRNAVSLLIHYSRKQVEDARAVGVNVKKRMPWRVAVAALSKNPDEIDGIICADDKCNRLIPIGARYLRRRSNRTTKTYHISCAERLGLRR